MKKITLIFISLTIYCYAQAEEDYVIVPKKTEIEDGSSAHNRIDKKYQVVGQLMGIGPNSTYDNFGIQAGRFLDRETLLLVEAMTGTKTTSFTNSSFIDNPILAQSFGFHFKQHPGNSFYYKAGIDYRKIDYRYTLKGNPWGNETISFNGESAVATFQIGNQWQWDNFTLGCDWFGLSIPFYTQVKDEYISPAALQADQFYNTDYRERLDDKIAWLVKSPQATLVRFYLGISF